MSHSEARFLARMLFGRTRTLSDEQRSEQSERARKTITKEELWWRGRIGRLEDKIHSRAGLMPPLREVRWRLFRGGPDLPQAQTELMIRLRFDKGA